MNSSWHVLLVVGLSLAGCSDDRRMRLAPVDAAGGGSDAATSSDAGAPEDSAAADAGAGADVDAATGADAGSAPLADAGAGVDAGGPPSTDAGSPPRPDAGPPLADAGLPRVDAGAGAATPDAHGQIVISEIMANPVVLADTVGEWLELYNPSTLVTYELSGCVLSDLGADSHTIGSSVRIPPRGYVSLARTATPGFTPTYVYSAFNISNTADEIVLTCGGVTIDQVVYDTATTWSIPAGASLSLSPGTLDAVSNDTATSWCPATTPFASGDLGTPGLPNGC